MTDFDSYTVELLADVRASRADQPNEYMERRPGETDGELRARALAKVRSNLKGWAPCEPAWGRIAALYLHSPEFRWAWHRGRRTRDPLEVWPPVLRPDAEPPQDRFETLSAVEPKFSRSFRRMRSDLRDTSDSSYDTSLAIFARRYGWTAQDVANLIISGRRSHVAAGALRKGLRADYMQRTIINAILRMIPLPQVPEL